LDNIAVKIAKNIASFRHKWPGKEKAAMQRDMQRETVIVGGGMAGMSCALKLHEAGRDALLITKALGGRVCYDPKVKSNFGAVFVMENYNHSRKIVDTSDPMVISLGNLMLHTSPTKYFKGLSATMIASVPQLLKFKRFMTKKFMPEYKEYKQDCETMEATDALDKHPSIKRYYSISAQKCIEELGVGKICDNFISKFAYSCTGSRIVDLNALDFLNVAQGVIVPLYNFTFNPQKFTETLDGNVLIDEVKSIERQGDEWTVCLSENETVHCMNLVVATETRIAAGLLNLGPIRQPVPLGSYLVRGRLKQKYAPCEYNFFSDSFDIIAIVGRGDGTYNVYTNCEMGFDDYFETWELIEFRFWTDALYTLGDVILQQSRGNGLYLAGDHNGLGLEPAAISGIYAANCILSEDDAKRSRSIND
jgi:hypothetical protein